MQINPIILDDLSRLPISSKQINPIRCQIGIIYDKAVEELIKLSNTKVKWGTSGIDSLVLFLNLHY